MKQKFTKTVIISIVILTVFSCGRNTEQGKIVRPVKVEKTILEQNSDNRLVIPASINESRETKLSFRVGGPLIMLNDVVGSYVKAGEVVAKIDPRDFKIAIEATESKYKLAKAEYERYKKLAEQGSVSKSVFDQMETNYKLAKTDFETASNAFVDTELKAPFSGYINGVFVNNYEKIVPGAPIVSFLDISKFEVKGWISVKDAASINSETVFTCIAKQGNKEVRIPGKLKEIGSKTSVSKQSLPITIVINSSDKIKLWAGMSTYLEIAKGDTKGNASVFVSVASVFTRDNQTKVWIFNADSNTVSSQIVTTGKVLDNGKIEILKGLAGTETIVCAGANYLFEGQEVKKMEEFSSSNVGNKL